MYLQFYKMIFFTTLLTALISLSFYMWYGTFGLIIGMIAMAQAHFFLAYLFKYHIFKRWKRNNILWRNLGITLGVVLIYYLAVYRGIAGNYRVELQIGLIYALSLIYFLAHNARDTVRFYREYNCKFGKVKSLTKDKVAMAIIFFITLALELKLFFGNANGGLFASPDNSILFNGPIELFSYLYYGLILGALFLLAYLLVIKPEKQSKILLSSLATIFLFGLVILVKYLNAVDLLNLILIWHFTAWIVFFLDKINFYQKKFKSARSDLILWLRQKPARFGSFVIMIHLFFFFPIFIIYPNATYEMAIFHPIYGLYWFFLYSVAHITISWFSVYEKNA